MVRMAEGESRFTSFVANGEIFNIFVVLSCGNW
jgi:hypothetical protein